MSCLVTFAITEEEEDVTDFVFPPCLKTCGENLNACALVVLVIVVVGTQGSKVVASTREMSNLGLLSREDLSLRTCPGGQGVVGTSNLGRASTNCRSLSLFCVGPEKEEPGAVVLVVEVFTSWVVLPLPFCPADIK